MKFKTTMPTWKNYSQESEAESLEFFEKKSSIPNENYPILIKKKKIIIKNLKQDLSKFFPKIRSK